MDTLKRLGMAPTRSADQPAILFDGRTITRGDLQREIKRFAQFLKENLPARELLAILLPNCPELLSVCMACWQAGIVPVPVNTQMKWPEVQQLLNHARIRSVVTTRSVVAAPAGDFAGTPVEWICYAGSGALTVETGNAGPGAQSPPLPDDLGLVLHTSGTTGRPRGVMLSRANLNHIIDDRLVQTGLGGDSLLVAASCLTQSVGLYQCLALVAAGGTLVLLRSYAVDELAETVNRRLPTHLIMVVDAFDRLLHHPKITNRSLSRLAFAAVGADRVTARVQDRFITLTGRSMCTTYGLTESSWALINPGDRIDKRLSLGKANSGVDIRLQASSGSEVAAGEVGEIHIRSPRTMIGYLHDADGTRAVLRDGWLASGDLAWRDGDGWYWFAGRSKNVIVLSSGDVVAPVEIEDLLRGYPGVSGCCVLGLTAVDGSEVPWAFVAGSGVAALESDLYALLRERISDYKIPRRMVFLDELPVGAGGKICHAALRDLAQTMLSGID